MRANMHVGCLLSRLPVAIALLVASAAWGQAATEANRLYRTEEGRAALKRGIAYPGRDAIQKPAEVVSALGIAPGSTVADVGTGVGYMLPYLSKAVGGSGLVLAEDIENEFLDVARKKVADEKLGNVKLVIGSETDPKLPAGAVDLEVLLDVYHHLDYPDKMLSALAAALRNGGRMAIVEFYRDAQPSGHIRLDRDGVIGEIESHGFRLTSRNDRITSQQYLLIFQTK